MEINRNNREKMNRNINESNEYVENYENTNKGYNGTKSKKNIIGKIQNAKINNNIAKKELNRYFL